jgi:hypothetical protein
LSVLSGKYIVDIDDSISRVKVLMETHLVDPPIELTISKVVEDTISTFLSSYKEVLRRSPLQIFLWGNTSSSTLSNAKVDWIVEGGGVYKHSKET